jgi:hypothetical protein
MHRIKRRTPSDEPHKDQSDDSSFHGFPSSVEQWERPVKDHTPYHRGRGTDLRQPEDHGDGEGDVIPNQP